MTVQGPFIDGTQTDASTGEGSSVRNPASGEEIARVRRASAEDVHRAVTVAHERYREGVWRAASVRERRAVETGMLSINSSSSVHIEAPFGGVKQSGVGREQGMAALEHYTEYKSVFIADA